MEIKANGDAETTATTTTATTTTTTHPQKKRRLGRFFRSFFFCCCSSFFSFSFSFFAASASQNARAEKVASLASSPHRFFLLIFSFFYRRHRRDRRLVRAGFPFAGRGGKSWQKIFQQKPKEKQNKRNETKRNGGGCWKWPSPVEKTRRWTEARLVGMRERRSHSARLRQYGGQDLSDQRSKGHRSPRCGAVEPYQKLAKIDQVQTQTQ